MRVIPATLTICEHSVANIQALFSHYPVKSRHGRQIPVPPARRISTVSLAGWSGRRSLPTYRLILMPQSAAVTLASFDIIDRHPCRDQAATGNSVLTLAPAASVDIRVTEEQKSLMVGQLSVRDPIIFVHTAFHRPPTPRRDILLRHMSYVGPCFRSSYRQVMHEDCENPGDDACKDACVDGSFLSGTKVMGINSLLSHSALLIRYVIPGSSLYTLQVEIPVSG